MSLRLDTELTFDSFAVASGSRMALSAARRMAESPGTYNPLVLHGPSGVGKTHLLHAIGNRALELRPRTRVAIEAMDSFVTRLSEAVARGALEEFRKECLRIDLLLLDDAQLLRGRGRTQDELMPIWDVMGQNGAQVVLACDRPPGEVDRLDARIEARFARAFTVDIRRAEPPAAPAVRATSFMADAWPAEFEQMPAPPAPAPDPVPAPAAPPPSADGAVPLAADDPFAAFLSDITETLAEVVDAAPWRTTLAETILRWGGEGMRTWRLENALELEDPTDLEALIGGYETDAGRLKQIAEELAELDPPAAASPVLRDPDRLAEAEALLLAARVQHRPLPPVPGGLTLSGFVGRNGLETPAVTTARRVVAELGRVHNPLFVYGPADRCTHYLAGIGHASIVAGDGVRATLIRGRDLADEARAVLAAGYVEIWKRRFDSLQLALIDGIEPIVGDPRTQELLLGLLDAMLRNRTQVVLSAAVPLSQLQGPDPRLISRVEGGVTIDLTVTAARRLLDGAAPEGNEVTAVTPTGSADMWYFNGEKLALDWLALDERLIEELT